MQEARCAGGKISREISLTAALRHSLTVEEEFGGRRLLVQDITCRLKFILANKMYVRTRDHDIGHLERPVKRRGKQRDSHAQHPDTQPGTYIRGTQKHEQAASLSLLKPATLNNFCQLAHHYRVGAKRRSPSGRLTAARLMDSTHNARRISGGCSDGSWLDLGGSSLRI